MVHGAKHRNRFQNFRFGRIINDMNITKLRKIILEELSLGGSDRPYRRPRKLGLVDYLGESSDHHLLELDDDSIISTGARIHEALDTVGDADGTGDGDEPDVVSSALSPAAPAGVETTPAVPGTPAPIPVGVPGATSVTPPPPASAAATPTPEPSTDADDVGRFPAAAATDSDSIGDDVDDASVLRLDPDVDASSDGLGSSIINRLIAGAGEEDARRSSAAGTGTGAASPPTTPLPEPPLPPSTDATDITGPESATSITDKRALSRYLDQVALGSVRVSLDESRRFKQKFRG